MLLSTKETINLERWTYIINQNNIPTPEFQECEGEGYQVKKSNRNQSTIALIPLDDLFFEFRLKQWTYFTHALFLKTPEIYAFWIANQTKIMELQILTKLFKNYHIISENFFTPGQLTNYNIEQKTLMKDYHLKQNRTTEIRSQCFEQMYPNIIISFNNMEILKNHFLELRGFVMPIWGTQDISNTKQQKIDFPIFLCYHKHIPYLNTIFLFMYENKLKKISQNRIFFQIFKKSLKGFVINKKYNFLYKWNRKKRTCIWEIRQMFLTRKKKTQFSDWRKLLKRYRNRLKKKEWRAMRWTPKNVQYGKIKINKKKSYRLFNKYENKTHRRLVILLSWNIEKWLYRKFKIVKKIWTKVKIEKKKMLRPDNNIKKKQKNFKTDWNIFLPTLFHKRLENILFRKIQYRKRKGFFYFFKKRHKINYIKRGYFISLWQHHKWPLPKITISEIVRRIVRYPRIHNRTQPFNQRIRIRLRKLNKINYKMAVYMWRLTKKLLTKKQKGFKKKRRYILKTKGKLKLRTKKKLPPTIFFKKNIQVIFK